MTAAEHHRIRDQYDTVSKIGTHIPDTAFLSGKAYHQRKVFLSRYLDAHPGTWLPILRVKLFLKDNFNLDLMHRDAHQTQTEKQGD